MQWQAILRKNFTKLDALSAFLELSLEDQSTLDDLPVFPLNVPLRLAQKMAKKTIDDPLFKQFVPLKKERISKATFSTDPIEERRFLKSAKLLHKYQRRVLFITTSACAMHCRYCFRRNFPYETAVPDFEKECALVRSDESIEEVILSGGDPLSLPDRVLSGLFETLNAIEHLQRIRIHTRFPIGIPERINEPLLQIFEKSKKQLFFVLHANHPLEFDDDVWQHISHIQKLGIPVLNQSVLLKGINDAIETHTALLEALINHGIIPYYLHALDRVEGAAHFEVAQAKGKTLIKQLMHTLPGYAIPRYVQEIAGQASKTPIK